MKDVINRNLKLYKLIDFIGFDELNDMVRWNGMPRIKDETVGAHIYIVTVLSRFLAEELLVGKNRTSQILEVITYATFHENDELISGDINHNVKYNSHNGPAIRQQLKSYIDFIGDKIISEDNSKSMKLFSNMLKEEISPVTKYIVKIADWLSMLMYLVKESNLGNKYVQNRIYYIQTKIEEVVELLSNQLVIDLQEDEYDGSILEKISLI